jgi:hypothetical protein
MRRDSVIQALGGKTIVSAGIVSEDVDSPITGDSNTRENLVFSFSDGSQLEVRVGGNYGQLAGPANLDLILELK